MWIITQASRLADGAGRGGRGQLYGGERARAEDDGIVRGRLLQSSRALLPLHQVLPGLCGSLARTCALRERGLARDDRVLRRLVHLAHLLALEVRSLDPTNHLRTMLCLTIHP